MESLRREEKEKAGVEWARCPGEFAPQIKLILNSTLVKITWSTFTEGDIKLIYSIINRYQALRIN